MSMIKCFYCDGIGFIESPQYGELECFDCNRTGWLCNLCGEPNCDDRCPGVNREEVQS